MKTEMADASSINRVIIGVDTSLQSLDLLEFAAKLAARRHIELAVLFIEDANLINFAALPFAREIDLISAADRELDHLRIMRTMQSQARKMSRLLEHLASQLKVNYSFRVLRGDCIAEVLSASLQTDVLFLSKRVGRYRKLKWERPRPRPRPPAAVSNKTFCVMYDGSPGSDRALALARELALAAGRELLVLLRVDEREDAGRLREQASAIMASQDAHVHYAVITDENSSLDKALQQRPCEILILHRGDGEQLKGSLLEQAECPVVLVQ